MRWSQIWLLISSMHTANGQYITGALLAIYAMIIYLFMEDK